ncbi:MAG: glycosyltransferase family 4 protein [Candidatus Euphemobacter frigidus]|nr:glycosyltransferase family 4 protein [Candidatus Euphemobacter frigidus]MDP8275477.1 glycosyltransferase family 4 protein [Candidatus Euphemobacter frigidus]
MKSLLVTHSSRWNGETEYAAGLIRAEAALGMDVTVVAPRESVLAQTAAGFARLLELPGKAPSRSFLDFIRDVRWLSGLIGRGGYNVLHSSRAPAHLMVALAARKRVPLLHLRGGAKRPYGHPGNRFLYRCLTDGVLVSSSRVEGWVTRRLKVPPERVHRILSPVDIEQFKPSSPDRTLRNELGIPDNAELIVKVARLAPVKGHDLLLEGMAIVRREFPRAVLVLVGNPWAGQPARLKEQAERLGIGDAVVFTGRRGDIPRFLASAAVCVSSSIGSEENSRAVSEYMACGCPVVATAVGVIPELVVEGETGLLVPRREPGALAEALLTILRDPERGRKLGEEGRLRAVREFSEEAFGRRLSRVFESIGLPAESK